MNLENKEIIEEEDSKFFINTINYFKSKLETLGKNEKEKELIRYMIEIDLNYKITSINQKENNIKLLVGGMNKMNKRNSVEMNKINKLRSKRMEDLLDTMNNRFETIKKLEDQLTNETRVTEKERIKNEKKEIKALLIEDWLELENLIPIDERCNEDIRNSLFNFRSYFLKDIDFVLKNLEKNQLVELMNEIENVLNSFNHLKTFIKEIPKTELMINQESKIQNKLRISIPIIPFLLKYEGEISTEAKASLNNLWEKIKYIFKK